MLLTTLPMLRCSILTIQKRLVTVQGFSLMARTPSSANPFSSVVSPALSKLAGVLEDYRQKNFGQTLFSRYIKEMVCAMDANNDGMISRSELAALLRNIGAEQELTDKDLQSIIDELGEGDDEKQIHVDCVQDLILNAGSLKNQKNE